MLADTVYQFYYFSTICKISFKDKMIHQLKDEENLLKVIICVSLTAEILI